MVTYPKTSVYNVTKSTESTTNIRTTGSQTAISSVPSLENTAYESNNSLPTHPNTTPYNASSTTKAFSNNQTTYTQTTILATSSNFSEPVSLVFTIDSVTSSIEVSSPSLDRSFLRNLNDTVPATSCSLNTTSPLNNIKKALAGFANIALSETIFTHFSTTTFLFTSEFYVSRTFPLSDDISRITGSAHFKKS
jgi:hypothetical protein